MRSLNYQSRQTHSSLLEFDPARKYPNIILKGIRQLQVEFDPLLRAWDVICPVLPDSVTTVERKNLEVIQEILSHVPLEMPPSIKYQQGRAAAIQFAAQIGGIRRSLLGSHCVLYLRHSLLEVRQLLRRISNMPFEDEYR